MIEHSKYLIVGASHAGLEALRAIRAADETGDITLVSRDAVLPYSPTVLPYVVSGEADARCIFLCDDAYFAYHSVRFLRGERLGRVQPEEGLATMDSGARLHFDKLLLATGAAPVIPPVPGLAQARFHVLRTLADAAALRDAASRARQAVVLGAGLVGMHAAESLARAGLAVTVVEMQSQVLPGYFDAEAAGLIQDTFARHGVRVLTGRRAVACRDGGELELDRGERLPAELLLVSTGVQPDMSYLAGTGIECDRGILVDDSMRTSAANVWAAGDVAQARGFFGDQRVLNAILPDAVEQGRVAGMDMADEREPVRYRGGVPLNTYHFFGKQAVSVGVADGAGCEVHRLAEREAGRYLKVAIRDNRLEGIFAIDLPIDGGVMWEFIRRRIDLGPFKERFLAKPVECGRAFMSRTWR